MVNLKSDGGDALGSLESSYSDQGASSRATGCGPTPGHSFRTEAFNVLNTTQFAFPTAWLGNASSERISSTANAYNPRVIQFAGKVHF